MASVAVVNVSTTSDLALYLQEVLDDMGHTVTLFTNAAVTAGNLSAFALIVVGQETTVSSSFQGFIDDYLWVDDIPVIVAAGDFAGGSDGVCDITQISTTLGLTPSTLQNAANSGDTSGFVVDSDWQDHVVGEGFRSDTEFGLYGNDDSKYASLCLATTDAAGVNLVRDPNNRVAANVVDTGDDAVGDHLASTFTAPAGWLGVFNQDDGWVGDAPSILRAMVDHCLALFPTTFSTTITSSVVFAGISGEKSALDPDTYLSSVVDWDQTLPTNTTIVVGAALDGETFSTVTKGSVIPGLTLNDDMTGIVIHFKVTLATTDGVSTPTFGNFTAKINYNGAAITGTPTDYFRGGHIKWTSGNNINLSMEVKDYDPATNTIQLFLPMPRDITIADTFEILPGCDKSFATCRDKFSNGINFRGFPSIPGEDAVLQRPDPKI